MATETGSPLAPPDWPPGGYRPVLPETGIAPWLRRIAGVREDILDWIPEERSRYTRLGAIVLNTGILAGASMLVGLANVTGVLWVFLLPMALLWAYVIATFDGWIVAGTHGMMTGKWRIFLPRLMISILVGAFVAEPLVLWFFHPAIGNEIPRMRAGDLADYRAQWIRCNPASGSQPAGCARFALNVAGSPYAVSQELHRAQQNEKALDSQIANIQNVLAQRENLARAECIGAKGPQFSGVIGEGPNCRRDRSEADQYRRDSGIADLEPMKQAGLQHIQTLNNQLARSQQDYGTEIKNAINQQVAVWQNGQGRPGLLDEERALQLLSVQSGFVKFQQWLLRLLLIAIDSLPVITKWLSRTTFYDRLYTRQLETGSRLHEKEIGLKERGDTITNDVRLRQAEHQYQADMARIAGADRAGRADREVDQRAEIEALAARLRADWSD
jgi:hypothetical protein